MESPKKKKNITKVDDISKKSVNDLLKLCKPLSVKITRLPNWVITTYGPQSSKLGSRGPKSRWKRGFIENRSQRKYDLQAYKRKILKLAMAHSQLKFKPKNKKQDKTSNLTQETNKQTFNLNIPDRDPSAQKKTDAIVDERSEEINFKSKKKKQDKTSDPKEISDDRSLNSNAPDQEPSVPEKIHAIFDGRSEVVKSKSKKKKHDKSSDPKDISEDQSLKSNDLDQEPPVPEKIHAIFNGRSEEVKSKSKNKRQDTTSHPTQISEDQSLNSNDPDQEPSAPERVCEILDPRCEESNTQVVPRISKPHIDSQEKYNPAIVEAADKRVDDDDCSPRKQSLRKRKRQPQTLLLQEAKKLKTADDYSASRVEEESLSAEIASTEIVTPRTRTRKRIRRQINALVVLTRIEDSRDCLVVQWRNKTKLVSFNTADLSELRAADRIEEELGMAATEESPVDVPISSENDEIYEESVQSTVTTYDESSTNYEVSSNDYTTETEDNDEEIMSFLRSPKNIGSIANDFCSSSSDGSSTIGEVGKTPHLRRSTRTQRFNYSTVDSASDSEQPTETTMTTTTSTRVLRSRAKTPSIKRPETRMSRLLPFVNAPANDCENPHLERTLETASSSDNAEESLAVTVVCEKKSSNQLVTNDSSSDGKCNSEEALRNMLDVIATNPTCDENKPEPEKNVVDRADCDSSAIYTDSEEFPINDASSNNRDKALIARRKLTALNAMVVLTRLEDFDDISESISATDSGMDFKVADDCTTMDPLQISTEIDNSKVEKILENNTRWSQDTAESDVELTLVLEDADKSCADETETQLTSDEGISSGVNRSKINSSLIGDTVLTNGHRKSLSTNFPNTSPEKQKSLGESTSINHEEATTVIENNDNSLSPKSPANKSMKKSKKLSKKTAKRKTRPRVDHPICNVCSINFVTTQALSEHIYTHSPEELQEAFRVQKAKLIADCQATRNVVDSENNETRAEAAEISSANVDVEEEKKGEKIDAPRNVVATTEDESYCSAVATAVCPCHKDDKANIDKNEFQIEMALVCQYCRILFRRRECFEVHYRTSPRCANDRTQGRWPKLFCANCQLTLDDWANMRNHLEFHASRNPEGTVRFVCNICRVVFVGFGALFSSHWASHSKDPMFVASRYTFPKISVQPIDGPAKLPIGASEDENYIWVAEHVCAECKKSFLTRRDLALHRETCGSNKQISTRVTIEKDPPNEDQSLWYCDACQLYFADRDKFNEHGVSSHDAHWTCVSTTPKQITFMCTKCYAMKKRIKEIEEHWKTHPQQDSCQVDISTNKTVFQTCAESDSSTSSTNCTENNEKSSSLVKKGKMLKSPEIKKSRVRALEDPCVNIVMSDSSSTDRGSASLIIDESSINKSNHTDSYQILMMDNNPESTSGPIKMVLGRKSAGKPTNSSNPTKASDGRKMTNTAGTEEKNSVDDSLGEMFTGEQPSEVPDIIEIIEEIEVPTDKSSPKKFNRSPRKKLASKEKTGNSGKTSVIKSHSSYAGSPTKVVTPTRNNKSLPSSPTSFSVMSTKMTDSPEVADNNTMTRRETDLSFEESRYEALSLSKKLDVTKSSEPVESNKPMGFLRVKNLSELQAVREHVCAICNANFETIAALDEHSQLHLENSFGKRGKFSKGMSAALVLPDSSERPNTPIAIAPKPKILSQAFTQPYMPPKIAVLSRSSGASVNWINVDNINKNSRPIAKKSSSSFKFKSNSGTKSVTRSVITSTASIAQSQLNSGPIGYITVPDKNRGTSGYHILPAMVVPSAQNNRQQYTTVAPQQNASSKILPPTKNTDHPHKPPPQQGTLNKIICTICTTFQCDNIDAFNEHITKHFFGFNKPNVPVNKLPQSAVIPAVIFPPASGFDTVNNDNVIPSNAAKAVTNDRMIVNNWILPNTPTGCTTSTFTRQSGSSGLPITSQSILSSTVASNSNRNETSLVTTIKQSVSSSTMPKNSNNPTNTSNKQPAGWSATTFNNADDVSGGITAYRCMICKSVMYRDYEHVRRHVLVVHGVESFLKCRIENIVEKNYVCTLCPTDPQPYDSPAKLKNHQTTVHGKTCPTCNSVFHNYVFLLDHITNCCTANSHGN